MGQCEVCGNEYELAFQVITAGVPHTFDCFECAIHKLAPICEHCGCKIVGHGVEAHGKFFCCAHCAHVAGVGEIVDNADHLGASRSNPPAAGAKGGTGRPMQAGAAEPGVPMESWRGSALAEEVGASGRIEDDVEEQQRRMDEGEQKLGFTDPE